MAWQPQTVRSTDNATYILPQPVLTVDFAGANTVSEAAVPLVAGVMITAVSRGAATLTLSGLLTTSPDTTHVDDLTAANKDEVIAAIHSLKSEMENHYYEDGEIDVSYTVYLATGAASHLFCKKCRLASLDFAESPVSTLAIPYTLTFLVPDGLLRYERVAV